MSRYIPYQPNERIVDRAVALWIAMLSNPKYDNLGPDSQEPLSSKLPNMIANMLAASLPKNNTPDVLTKFGEELKKILMAPFTWTSDFAGEKKEYTHLVNSLSVDYGADVALRTAAERAGLKMEFPYKTTMHLSADKLSLSYGYGAEYVCHYPLSNDHWFVTTLYGSDVDKIIGLIESGRLTPELTIPMILTQP